MESHNSDLQRLQDEKEEARRQARRTIDFGEDILDSLLGSRWNARGQLPAGAQY